MKVRLKREMYVLTVCMVIVGVIRLWGGGKKEIKFSPDTIDTDLVGELEYIV